MYKKNCKNLFMSKTDIKYFFVPFYVKNLFLQFSLYIQFLCIIANNMNQIEALSENALSVLLLHSILVLRLMHDKDRMMQ